ncbi:MAG: adenylosuccinate lyase [Acidimicrobiales bacterium]
MIARYSLPEMARLFSEESRLSLWLEIELLALEAWAELGVVPSEHASACRARAPKVDGAFVVAVAERELVTDHDVAAFVDVVQEAIGSPEGNWFHHGLTSSDVVDTALCATLVKASELLLDALEDFISVLARLAREHAATPMVGRTHGMHAEPTTFGAKLALFCLQADRDRARLRAARENIAVGKLSGAVGTFSNIDPYVEEHVCRALGLQGVPATQVIARDRHAQFLYACAGIGTTLESLALEIRHLQRSEVREVEEAFGARQKGSSAMPHKRNPITAERLCGLARVLRGYVLTGLEDVALWHERDISHSSAERIVLPDASLVTYYGLRRATKMMNGLVVRADRMLENLLEGSYGLVFSQPVLLSLVEAGLSRDEAYRMVQTAARVASEERRGFREVLEKDAAVAEALRAAGAELSFVLDRAFDLDRALRHVHRSIDMLEETGQ